ncbi:MAG: DUF3347 domain-containing protein [Cyclobacteriaceae bacterium]
MKMKTRSIFFSLLFAATSFALLSNCSGKKEEAAVTEALEEDGHKHDEKTEVDAGSKALESSEPQFQVEAAFQNELAVVFTSYVSLKEAFVSSDAGKVKTEVSATNEALAKVDMKKVSGAAHNDWMNYHSLMQSSLNTIESTGDIEAQRKAFSTLSDHLYKSIKAFGLSGKDAYYDFCPMAFNNEGGYWLSDQKQIRNPYYGEKMLTCGAVKEKLN